MANQKMTTQARRRLLKALSIGTVASSSQLIPKNWVRPVVASVMLPAHASRSPTPTEPTPICNVAFSSISQLGISTVTGGGSIEIDNMTNRFVNVVLDGTVTIPRVAYVTVVPIGGPGNGSYSVNINNYPATQIWCSSIATMFVYPSGTPSYTYCSDTATIPCIG